MKTAACDWRDLPKLLVHPEEPSLPDMMTVQGGDVSVPHSAFGSLWVAAVVVVGNRGRADAPFTMLRADMASGARF